MKRHLVSATLAALMAATPAMAHYCMIIPNDPMISQADGRSVALTMSFSHPFETDGMLLEKPVSFSVTHEGTTTDLLGGLQGATVMDDRGYTLDYAFDRPGTYIFSMEPQPYWEPAEDAFTFTTPKPTSQLMATTKAGTPSLGSKPKLYRSPSRLAFGNTTSSKAS